MTLAQKYAKRLESIKPNDVRSVAQFHSPNGRSDGWGYLVFADDSLFFYTNAGNEVHKSAQEFALTLRDLANDPSNRHCAWMNAERELLARYGIEDPRPESD